MKNSRIVTLATFAMVVFGGVETAFANPIYSFTTIDVPGGYDTIPYGINNSGQIVGGFNDGDHGFLYTGGNFTIFDDPREGRSAFNEAHGINNSGQIVGQSSLGAFLDTGGSFTTIDVPGAKNTYAYGINDSGQIVGYFFGFAPPQGFVYTGGNFTTFTVPGAIKTAPYGINNSGQIVGSFFDGVQDHGFLDTGGIFTTIDGPGATHTFANGINNSGKIVGLFFDGVQEHGFLYTGGIFTTIDVPGATSTAPIGINDSGQIVGTFSDATGGQHGFIASPVPEPLVVGVGDFNADGHADVLWFNANTGTLVEWLLDGQGNVIANPILSLTCGSGAEGQRVESSQGVPQKRETGI